MRASSYYAKRRSSTGFTLIELLVVIAIIAILTAILLPVFATVRENARASNSMSNMHAISTGLAQFELDHHRYPDVLFGYAVPGAAMNQALDQAESVNQADMYFPGLYPEYVKDYRIFTDPNNNVAFSATASVPVNVLAPCDASQDAGCSGAAVGTLVPTSRTFYKADAYDSSPAITNTNAIDTGTFVARYQSSWTNVDSAFDCAQSGSLCGANSENLYTHQLRWKNPPAETYVDSTTYHVQQSGKVLVLWENGSVRKVDVSQFLACSTSNQCTASGVTSESGQTSVAAAGGVSGVNFWKLDPTGP